MKNQNQIASEPKNSNLTSTLEHETRKNRVSLKTILLKENFLVKVANWFEENGTLLHQKMVKAGITTAAVVALAGSIALNGCQEKPEKEPEIPHVCNEELKEVIQNYVFTCTNGHRHPDAGGIGDCLANQLNNNTNFKYKHVTVGGKATSFFIHPISHWVDEVELERISVLDSRTPTTARFSASGNNFVVTKD